MKAILLEEKGGPDVLRIRDVPDPVCAEDGLLIRVRATALNRADLLQRRGLYPPPPGVPDIPGLEAAGEVVDVGSRVEEWKPGDRVMALLPGGGYAEYVAVAAGAVMRVPEAMTFEEAAAVPEAFLTAWLNLVELAKLMPGERVLVHAAASGVGTAAVQLARELGARVLATAGSEEKLRVVRNLGAEAVWNYRDGSFRQWVLEQTEGRGVDVVFDLVGGLHWSDNLASLAPDGRLLLIGTLGGSRVERLDLNDFLMRRLKLLATTLRSRGVEEKARLVRAFADFASERLRDGRLRPVVDSVFDWRDAADAHRRMEANLNIGKIVLRVT